MRNYSEQEITKIIEHYRKKNTDAHVVHCKSQHSLEKAIQVAAQSLNALNKTHHHQLWIGKATLNQFAQVLIQYTEKISNAESFDELLSIIKKAKVKGVGRLTQYDTAFRIGNYMHILPDKIYLHAGTKCGAIKILGTLPRQSYLLKTELPIVFQKTDLEPWELEDVLCIYFKVKKKKVLQKKDT